jgi:hypothetical protein
LAHTVIYRRDKYMTMPRLSLYRPIKGNDYKFIDKTSWEMFQVGGTDVLIHKYLGPGAVEQWNNTTNYVAATLVSRNNIVYKSIVQNTARRPPNTTYWERIREGTPSQPIYSEDNPFNIQDLLFLENRSRKYDSDVYVLRGVYSISDIDFNLSQFGLFLQNDTVFITFHINDTVGKLGRKLISGDVIELPHLKDEWALNDLAFALKRFYVIEEVSRAAEGYSVTWYPHLYRAKCKPLVDSEEFKDILNSVADNDNFKGPWEQDIIYYPGDVVTGPDGKDYTCIGDPLGTTVTPPDVDNWELADSLRDILSTYNKEMQITAAVLNQAEADAPRSGWDTSKFYTIQSDSEGRVELITTDTLELDASLQTQATDENGNLLVDSNNDPIYVGTTASSVFRNPEYSDYQGQWLVGDGQPPNGAPFTSGISFPLVTVDGQYCLRTDYKPNRLFRYNGSRWVKMEDNVRMTMSNMGYKDVVPGGSPDNVFQGKEVRQNQKSTFINNEAVSTINEKEIIEKQALSKILRPRADE